MIVLWGISSPRCREIHSSSTVSIEMQTFQLSPVSIVLLGLNHPTQSSRHRSTDKHLQVFWSEKKGREREGSKEENSRFKCLLLLISCESSVATTGSAVAEIFLGGAGAAIGCDEYHLMPILFRQMGHTDVVFDLTARRIRKYPHARCRTTRLGPTSRSAHGIHSDDPTYKVALSGRSMTFFFATSIVYIIHVLLASLFSATPPRHSKIASNK